jgi:hypothetical protein
VQSLSLAVLNIIPLVKIVVFHDVIIFNLQMEKSCYLTNCFDRKLSVQRLNSKYLGNGLTASLSGGESRVLYDFHV